MPGAPEGTRGLGDLVVRIHHVGVACRDASARVAAFRALGFKVHGPEEVPRQRVRTYFVETGDGSLELVEPTSDDSPISSFLEKRGETMHHVALQVRDIVESMRRLEGRVEWTSPASPGARRTTVVFIHPRSVGGVLVELVEDPERP